MVRSTAKLSLNGGLTNGEHYTDARLLVKIEAIKLGYPFWGYRRVRSYLRYRECIVVGKNHVYRVMKEHHVLVQKNRKLRAKRGELKPKPRAVMLNQYWGMDMTKIKFPSGWAYLHVVKDWYSKEIVGWSLSLMSRTDDCLQALNEAINSRFPCGIKSDRRLPELITDNGCQPTSERVMRACSSLGLRQIVTSFNNPKGNADTERMIRTMKEEFIWFHECDSFEKLKLALDAWVQDYNAHYLHSTLGYMPPNVFEQRWLDQQPNSPLMAA